MIRRSHIKKTLLFDPEVEANCRRQNADRSRRLKEARMADQRTLKDFVQPRFGSTSCIAMPNQTANNLEIKTSLINVIMSDRFSGLPMENPSKHLNSFMDKCGTLKINGLDEEAVRFKGLAKAFLTRFFPPGKTANLTKAITNFSQFDTKELYDAWERFKNLQRQCPHHGIEVWRLIQLFYNGLKSETRFAIDTSIGGTIMTKTPATIKDLIENLAINHYQWPNERAVHRKGHSSSDFDAMATLVAKIESLNASFEGKLAQITKIPQQSQESPNFCVPSSRKSTKKYLESLLETSIMQQNQKNDYFQNSLQQVTTRLEAMTSHNKMIETQISPLAQQLANSTKPQGQLPCQPEPNPRVQMNAIVLRNGKVLKEVERKTRGMVPKGGNEGKAKSNEGAKVPNVPFPAHLAKAKLEAKFGKFLEMMRQLHITIPFMDAITEIPTYAKFLKGLISTKRRSRIILSEECSTLIPTVCPVKLGDPGSFSIPCSISGLSIRRVLCDLGASVNLMPVAIANKDLPLQVGNFIIPCDFVVLEMVEDVNTPSILDHPFLATVGAIINAKNGKLSLNVGKDKVEFKLRKSMGLPPSMDDIQIAHALETVFSDEILVDEEDAITIREILDGSEPFLKNVAVEAVPAMKEDEVTTPPKVELKPLPSNLKYAFLGDNDTYPVIVNASLSSLELDKLLVVLRKYGSVLAYSIDDIKGISPSFCTHRILLSDEHATSIEHQRRLNRNMKEVVQKEVMKLLKAGIIYPISDSPWVSPVQVVPKKECMTVIKNDKDELISTRPMTG
ncbi:hypothetical protein OSB04_018993 [Centaurea solstitialis]|uniref:Retrotransposon gag domain-containing protein n=1 Tax=Centaurea solstitialis TaxID=347529 RepID=A0AA38SPF3_9ASTR|nr:hypothetical protein OSB04_018993 [Centaurea solstitialis]